MEKHNTIEMYKLRVLPGEDLAGGLLFRFFSLQVKFFFENKGNTSHRGICFRARSERPLALTSNHSQLQILNVSRCTSQIPSNVVS